MYVYPDKLQFNLRYCTTDVSVLPNSFRNNTKWVVKEIDQILCGKLVTRTLFDNCHYSQLQMKKVLLSAEMSPEK